MPHLHNRNHDLEPGATLDQAYRIRSLVASLRGTADDAEVLVRIARTRDQADRVIASLRRLWARRRRM